MSRGPGWLERAIEALFDAERDTAFTLEELCERIYGVHRDRDPEATDLRPAHRNAVARAARKVGGRRPEIQSIHSQALSNPLVFFRHDEVMSYAMAQLKSYGRYRSNDRRLHWSYDEQALRKQLAEDRHRKLVEPGGAWWRHVQMFLAERAGDTGCCACRAGAAADRGYTCGRAVTGVVGKLIEDDAEVAELIRREVGAAAEHGTNQHSGGDHNAMSSHPGSATGVLRRLKRDRPDLAERVVRGELSANATLTRDEALRRASADSD